MKAPPKRKGNPKANGDLRTKWGPLNESPSEKEGKWNDVSPAVLPEPALNESPSEKEGKFRLVSQCEHLPYPSMKAPPKRKGNCHSKWSNQKCGASLNESPSEKEGK